MRGALQRKKQKKERRRMSTTRLQTHSEFKRLIKKQTRQKLTRFEGEAKKSMARSTTRQDVGRARLVADIYGSPLVQMSDVVTNAR